jgi:hypothetical protein
MGANNEDKSTPDRISTNSNDFIFAIDRFNPSWIRLGDYFIFSTSIYSFPDKFFCSWCYLFSGNPKTTHSPND